MLMDPYSKITLTNRKAKEMEYSVTTRFDRSIPRTTFAKAVALELAGGSARRLRPQPDGSVIVVNNPDFDTRLWGQAKARKARKH
jgi:hypothetical protein